MSTPAKVLFVDRDGTLVAEPSDEQVDRLDKIRLLPGVVPALLAIQRAGYRLVMVTNQDGLGTDSYPERDFRLVQRFILELLSSQGVTFDEVFVCPHLARDNCECRKPKIGLLRDWLAARPIDLARSAAVGDRDSDLDFARNLGVRALTVRIDGGPEASWEAVASQLTRPVRSARIERKTRETEIRVSIDLDHARPVSIRTGLGFFDHMLEQIARHGGFSLELEANGDLHVDEHHTVEDCALALGQALKQALGDRRGIARFGFLLPMDETQARIALDLSGRPYLVFEGRFNRERVGELPTELVPHFFRSLAETLGAAIQIHVQGENTHHMVEACFKGLGRSLRQAIRLEDDELPSSKGVL
jgi:imidazoleglycerol-phosphate dehydratase/histidinol-phosphatase